MWQVADVYTWRKLSRAGVGLADSSNDFEQRRLAGTIGPDKSDTITAIDVEGDVVEEQLVGETTGDAVEC